MPEEAHCRSCGAKTIWVKNKKGKFIPCNFTQLSIITDQGEIAVGRPAVIGMDGKVIEGWVCHFVTCPHADQWKKHKEET